MKNRANTGDRGPENVGIETNFDFLRQRQQETYFRRNEIFGTACTLFFCVRQHKMPYAQKKQET